MFSQSRRGISSHGSAVTGAHRKGDVKITVNDCQASHKPMLSHVHSVSLNFGKWFPWLSLNFFTRGYWAVQATSCKLTESWLVSLELDSRWAHTRTIWKEPSCRCNIFTGVHITCTCVYRGDLIPKGRELTESYLCQLSGLLASIAV